MPSRRPATGWRSARGEGTPHGRFQRAIQRGHLIAAETAAREMGSLSLSDALALCLLYERDQDPRCERAFRRWVSRARLEHGLNHEQVELLRAAAGALGTPFREVAMNAFHGVCRELRMPLPSGPS